MASAITWANHTQVWPAPYIWSSSSEDCTRNRRSRKPLIQWVCRTLSQCCETPYCRLSTVLFYEDVEMHRSWPIIILVPAYVNVSSNSNTISMHRERCCWHWWAAPRWPRPGTSRHWRDDLGRVLAVLAAQSHRQMTYWNESGFDSLKMICSGHPVTPG